MRDDGLWELDVEHDAVPSARQAVRERIVKVRRWAEQRPDPAAIEAARKHFEREREANAGRLAEMRRVLIHAFPPKKPEAVVLVDAGRREVTTFMGEEIAKAREKLAGYDIIAAIDVRALLRALHFDPGQRRVADLGPPQKTKQLNKRGRTLKISTSLLVQGSCGIGHPFAGEEVLRQYLRDGDYTKLRRRLESDAKSLFALYQYGCLHGAVRLRWGFLDERLPAPWVHSDEPTLYTLMRRAQELGAPLEIVAGSAPGWADPWSRVQRVRSSGSAIPRRNTRRGGPAPMRPVFSVDGAGERDHENHKEFQFAHHPIKPPAGSTAPARRRLTPAKSRRRAAD